ncbi:MAG: hypothetical protein P8N02_10455 [Actinomycetota bacterium]|jgi:hypothetical protein|nr:hypothetical protein [Actinomycetota bacterium]
MVELTPETENEIERWFIRRGLPHFIHHYNAAEDVFTRALPVLSVVFMLELVFAADTQWSKGQNAVALSAGLAVMVGGYAAVNRLRGRTAFQRPEDVGVAELGTFVLLPALLPLVIGGRIPGALLTIAFNIAVLAVVAGIITFGVVPMIRWAAAKTLDEIGGLLRLMARSLPLVLVFSMFIFLNAELWQVADDFTSAYFWAAIGVLAGVGSLFVLLRLPREVDSLRRFSSWTEVGAALSDSPLEPEDADELDDQVDPPALTRPDWFNVGLVWVFSQGVQILLVGLLIGIFYLVFGIFTVRTATIMQWTESPVSPVWVINERLVLTAELIRVSGFIAAFSSLQFAVSAVTDDTYRDEFLGDLVHDVREAFAVRALYLRLLGVTAATPDGPPGE